MWWCSCRPIVSVFSINICFRIRCTFAGKRECRADGQPDHVMSCTPFLACWCNPWVARGQWPTSTADGRRPGGAAQSRARRHTQFKYLSMYAIRIMMNLLNAEAFVNPWRKQCALGTYIRSGTWLVKWPPAAVVLTMVLINHITKRTRAPFSLRSLCRI